MALPLSSLVKFTRLMVDDYDDIDGFQEYSDENLIDYLRFAAILEGAEWDQGYSVQLNTENPDAPFYEIEPDPPEWLQMLIVTRAVLGMREWREHYSLDNKIIKKTSSNIKDVVEGLKATRAAILQERRYSCAGYAYDNWDDFFSRPNAIINKISQGFR
jgi:hypothetical protein